jgi:MtrB/PioB family decaheme-associated outer membrane protein
MNVRILLISLLFLTDISLVSAADNPQAVDSPEMSGAWKCIYCEFEQGINTSLEGGVGYVSEDSFKFGEYTGLNEKGPYVIGNVESRYRNIENANYWDFTAYDIGLDSRSLELKGGKQGKYKLSFSYNELPHYLSDTAKTPFVGSGGNRLTLRSDWVRSGSTAGMTALDKHLIDIDLKTKRTKLGAGAMYVPAPHWKTSVDYHHETREGQMRIAGSFYFNTAEFVQPVDYTSDSIDLKASYTDRFWQAKLSYHAATFRNQNKSLVWQNPYTPVVAGAEQGELAMPPDNQFHQVRASVALTITEKSKLTAEVALGRMTQNETFIDPTTNSTITTSPLPAASLDGRVDTVNAHAKWTTQLSKKLRVNAAYRYNDRDNQSPRHTYEWVITDSSVATPRSNLPYSFTKDTLKLDSEYRIADYVKTSLGYDYQRYERTYQEVEKNKEQTVWASLIARALDTANITLRLAHASREKDGYQVIAGVDNPENPLMRKYNMADRDRDSLSARVDFLATDTSNIGFNLDVTNDDYPDSSIGLTSSREYVFGFDVSTRLAMYTMFNLFFSFENISSDVSGSQLYSIADWSGSMNDRFDTAGMGLKHTLLKDKLDIGVNYFYTHSVGEISIVDGGSGSSLPDLVTRLNSVKFYGNYHLSDKLELKGTYWYEYFTSSDWALDGVGETTTANNLSLGQDSPSYNVHVLMLSMRYKW